MNTLYQNGVEACVAAFERLKSGVPEIAAHVGLPSSRITSGVVSVEAGFDRGYLKKARLAHRNLISDIDVYRKGAKLAAPKIVRDLKNAQQRIINQSKSVEEMTTLVQNVVAQNLQLIERVRTLELQLLSHNKVSLVKSDS